MVQEPCRCPTPEQSPEPNLGRSRVEEVFAADHEVDAVSKIIHHHAQGVGPVAVPVSDREVAPRCDRPGLCTLNQIHPRLVAVTKADPPGDAERLSRKPARGAFARATGPGPRPRVRRGPLREGRTAAVARVDEALCIKLPGSGLVRDAVVRLAKVRRPPCLQRIDRRLVRHETKRLEIVEQRRFILRSASLPVVVLDPQDHLTARCPRDAPGHERVGNVTEVEVARGRRRKSGSKSAPKVVDCGRERLTEVA